MSGHNPHWSYHVDSSEEGGFKCSPDLIHFAWTYQLRFPRGFTIKRPSLASILAISSIFAVDSHTSSPLTLRRTYSFFVLDILALVGNSECLSMSIQI